MQPDSNSLDSGSEDLVSGSSLESLPSTAVDTDASPPSAGPPSQKGSFKLRKKLVFGVGGVIGVVLLVAAGAVVLLGSHGSKPGSGSAASNFAQASLSTQGAKDINQLQVGQSDHLAVNGQLSVANTLVLTPTAAPSNPVAGQIYYGQNKQLYLYNGTRFIDLSSGAGGATTSTVSVQGGGAVTYSSGNGISINGSTITNAGVTSLTGTAGEITVSQASGGVTLGLAQDLGFTASPTFAGLTLSGLGQNGVLYGGGSSAIGSAVASSAGECLVSTSGAPVFGSCAGVSGTPGQLAMFTGSGASIGDSLINQSGSTISVNGDLSVTGTLSGDGSGLINLDADNVASGILPVIYGGTGAADATDARTNLGAAASGNNSDITGLTDVSSIAGPGALSVGSTSEPLFLQGSASTTLSVNDSGFTTTLGFTQPTADASIIVPNNSGTVAVQATGPLQLDATGNISCPDCLVSSSGGGGGTVGVISVNGFTGDVDVVQGTGLNVTNNNGTITVAANQDISTTATPTFGGLTLNGALGVGTSTPQYPVDVNGDINTNAEYLIDGVPICTSSGCTTAGGSGNYIQNGTALQTANLAIQSGGTGNVVAVIRGATGQTANILSVQNSIGTSLLAVAPNGRVGVATASPNYPLDVNGDVNTNGVYRINGTQIASLNLSDSSNLAKLNGTQTFTANNTFTGSGNGSSTVGALFQNSTNSTTAFQVQNAAGTSNLFDVDTTHSEIGIDTNTPGYTLDVQGAGNINAATALYIAGTQICTVSGCVSSGGSGSYIQNSTTVQSGANFAIQSAADNDIGALIKGHSNTQSADLLDVQNSAGTNQFSVSAGGVGYVATSLGVGVTNPSYSVETSGTIDLNNASASYDIDGTPVCSLSGCTASGGSGNYIQNNTTLQTANFAIQSAASATSPTAVIEQATSQTGDLIDFDTSSGSVAAAINPSGQLRVGAAAGYTSALNVGTNTTTAAGGITFGTDTNLYRSASGTLKTSGTFQAGELQESGADFATGVQLQSTTASSSNSTNLTFTDNEATPQSISLRKQGSNLVVVDNSGNVQLGFSPSTDGILFGPSLDTSLYRSGTNALTTGGALTVVGTFTNTGGQALFKNATNSTSAFELQNAAGTNLLIGDTSDQRIGIDTTTPLFALDVNGDINTSSVYRIGGTTICTSAGCTPASGSNYYIQNGVTAQNANFNIISNITGGVATNSPTAVIEQASTQTGDLIQLQNSSGVVQSSFSASGAQLKIDGATSYSSALTIGTSSDTTSADGISFGGDTSLFRSASGTLDLQGTGSTVTLQANPVSGTDQTGNNLDLAAGTGTGAGSSGNINFQVAAATSTPNESFITGASSPWGVAVNGSFIYWVNGGTNTIGRANLDGSSPNQNFITGANTPSGITIDGNYIYWANYGGNTIGRANLDGSSPNQNFITGATGPRGIAVNGSYIYWANQSSNTIGRANLDGSSPNQNFMTGTNQPTGIAIDSNYIYWTNQGSTNSVGRANLDGSSPNENLITGASVPRGIVVNSSYIYWANGGANTIGRANLNGSSSNQSFMSGATSPAGVTVDSNYIYWGNNTASTYGRVALGGTVADTPVTVASFAGGSGAALFQNYANTTTAFQIQNAAGTSNLFDADTADTRIGIGTNAPGNLLSVGTLTTAVSTAQLAVSTGSASNKGVVIQGVASQTADLLDVENSSGTLLVSVAASGNLTVATPLANPATPTLTSSSTGGSLTANTYYYAVAATNASGTTAAVDPNPAGVTTTGTTSVNTLTWTAVAGATGYVVYRVAGSLNANYFSNTVSSGTTSITDNGTNFTWATAGNPPNLNTTGGGYVSTGNAYQINGSTVLQTPRLQNTFVGIGAGNSNLTGNNDTSLGYNALASVTQGSYNVAIGQGTLTNVTAAIDNTAVGQSALNADTGSFNTALGTDAGTNNSSGTDNTFLGYLSNKGAGAQVNYSTAIGTFSNVNQSNAIILGCTNGVNGCTQTSTVGIGSQYAPNALTVSPGTYGTNGTAGTSSTITQSGTTITGSGTTFTSGMTGATIYYSDGTTATVTYISATSLTSSVSKTIGSAANYTIVYGGFNVTANGTAYLQPTSDSASAFQIQSAEGVTALNVSTTTNTTTLQAGTADDTTTLGSNLATCTDFTNTLSPCSGSQWTTTNWTTVEGVSGPPSTSTATHTTGNTSALSSSQVTPVSGTTYEIDYTISGSYTGSLTVTFGGQTVATYALAVNGATINESKIITATSNSGNLTFTPSSTFNGTISVVTIQQVTQSPVAVLVVNNASGAANIQITASSSTTNDFIGLSSGQDNSTGIQDTALGTRVLQNNTTGSNNAALGYQALEANTVGSNNAALGYQALESNTVGNENTAVGGQALQNSTTGYNDVAVGYETLEANTQGVQNVAVGALALSHTITNNNDTGIGYAALQLTTAGNDTAIGSTTLVSDTTGGDNVAVGPFAGSGNALLYSNSGNATTTGTNNTFLGFDALQGQASYQSSNSTALGTYSSVNQSNALILGCTNGVNGCTQTSTVGIGSQYAPNALTVSPNTYGTNGTVGSSTTITQSGTTIIGSGTTFTSSMTGGIIYYSDGTTATVTYVSATSLTSSVSKTISSAATYTIVYGGFNVNTSGYLGIGTTAPGNLLSVGLLTTADSSAQLAVSTGGTGNKALVLQAVTSQSADILDVESSSGSVLFGVSSSGHIITGGTTPTAVVGTAAGSGASVSVSGDDTLGTITVTTGSSPSTSGVLATLTFNSAFGTAPRVVISPSSAASSSAQFYEGTVNTTSFQVDVGAIPFGATSYTFNYFAGQ